MSVDVHGFLMTIDEMPELLPLAPTGVAIWDVLKRVKEQHICLVCGKESAQALTVHHTNGNTYWLDICVTDYETITGQMEIHYES